jgi:hypothetical protein
MPPDKASSEGGHAVELVEMTTGTRLRLTLWGFYDADSSRHHADSRPGILEHRDEILTSSP